jgi:CBS domain-containing protein
MEDIVSKSMEQNFVPVVDDQDHFIGIIRRREIIDYCFRQMLNDEPKL